jgi:hypothetical protein
VRRMRLPRLLHIIATAGLVPLLLGGGVATAAGATAVLLGRSNSSAHATVLANPHGSPLSLAAGRSAPPLVVNSSTKVAHLNADYLDGLDVSALQRRVAGRCGGRSGIVAISVTGAAVCAAQTYSIVWQVLVAADGTTQVPHAGVSVARTASGDYTLMWTGFPGRAVPYCTGVGRAPVMVSMSSDDDGNGSARLSFAAADTPFSCALIAFG